MFIVIITVNGFNYYYGPFNSRAEAREQQRALKKAAQKLWTNADSIHSEVRGLNEV